MQALDFATPLRAFVARRAPAGVEPDDLVQDIFLRIHERLPELRDSERLDAWIFQIARNVLADSFRSRRRREALTERAAFELSESPVNDDDAGGASELTPCIAPMIERLPEAYRDALAQTELQGVTQVEAARRAGLSISGMKSRVQRGRDQLKQMLLACCEIELDARGRVMGCCQSVRPFAGASDSMSMTTQLEARQESLQNTTQPAASGCCGGPAPEGASACCALDAEVKSTGGTGCGCNAATGPAASKVESPKKGCC